MLKRDLNSVLVLLKYGVQQGIDQELLLADTGISKFALADATVAIDSNQELQVIRNLVSAIGDPIRVGFEAAEHYSLTSYGIFGYALLASANVRSAIEFGIRYLELTYVFARLILEIADQQFSLTVSYESRNEVQTAALYRDLFAIVKLIKDVFPMQQAQMGLELKLSEERFRNIAGFKELHHDFKRGIKFECPQDAIIGLVSDLALPFPGAHPGTAQNCEKICQELLQKKRVIPGLSAEIRKLLVQSRLQISMDEVAQKLHMSVRTLHRRLKVEDMTFRKIRDQVTVDLAEELLKQPLKIDHIALQLGFSDSANFSHSFKRATGLSPGNYRLSLK